VRRDLRVTLILVSVLGLALLAMPLVAESALAPLPSCSSNPASVAVGKAVSVGGVKWQSQSPVTVSFDGSLVGTTMADNKGKFAVSFNVPPGSSRGSHSVNVAGTDSSGAGAHCAKVDHISK